MRTFYFLLILTIVIAGCKKGSNDLGTDNATSTDVSPADTIAIPDGCISRVYYNPASTLSATDQATVQQLFLQNNLSTANLQFYNYRKDPCPTCVTPGPYEYVSANQYFNGQLLLNGGANFAFRQGTYYFTGGTVYNSVPLDTVSQSSLRVLRKLFINQLNKDGFMANSTFKDSCLVAQFGYEYLADGSTPFNAKNFAKVWMITPKNHSTPVAYFRDDQVNTLIFYFDGIETLF